MKYRAKPLVKEAMQLTYDSLADILEWMNSEAIDEWDGDDVYIKIKTLEGVMMASYGDYIVKGIANEFYPVKPEIFEASYEPLTDETEVQK